MGLNNAKLKACACKSTAIDSFKVLNRPFLLQYHNIIKLYIPTRRKNFKGNYLDSKIVDKFNRDFISN